MLDLRIHAGLETAERTSGRGGLQDPRALPGDGPADHLRALRLLKRHPHYRFVTDQACHVQPLLLRYPEEAEAFSAYVHGGRMAC